MRIHQIAIRNFRGVVQHVVDLDPHGVTVIEGPNEIGKSSLAQSIDLLIDDLDSTGRRRVAETQPVGRDVGPEVSIEAETGPYQFSYRKRYLRERTTELHISKPKSEHHTGREAHERVQAILAETVDMALWRALRVDQGTGISQAELGGHLWLAAALDLAAGESPVGGDEMSLFAFAHAEYLRYWTETGRRKQEIGQLDRDIATKQDEIDRLGALLREIEDDIDRSVRLRTEIKGFEPRRLAQQATLAEREAVLSDLQRIEAQVENLRLALERRQAEANEAGLRSRVRSDAIAVVTDAIRREADAVLLSDSNADVRDAAAERAIEAEQAYTQVQIDRTRAIEVVRDLRNTLDRLRDNQRHRDLKERIEQIHALQAAIRQAAEGAADPIELAAVEVLRTLTRNAEIAGTTAAGTESRVELLAAIDLDLSVNDVHHHVEANSTFETNLARDATVDVPGVLTMSVRSGSHSDDSLARLDSATNRLAEVRGEMGVDDLAEAERRLRAKEHAAQVLADQRRILAQIAGTASVDDLMVEFDGLANRRGGGKIPQRGKDERTLRDTLAGAEEAGQRADNRLKAAERERDASRDRLREIDVERSERRSLAQAAALEVGRLEADLEVQRAEMADGEVEDLNRQSDVSLDQARSEFESASRELAREGIAEARIQVENARQVCNRTERDIATARDELIAVDTRLKDHGEEGLAEDRDLATSDLERLEVRRATYVRQAEARHLLYETIKEERDASRRTYVRPLQEAIEVLGKVVFGADFAVEVGDDLKVVSRTLRGRTVPFESLSVGAKEQIALISRLACGRIVAPHGGVPIILDDALGNSDPIRLQSMGAVLSVVAKDCQVIILTCQSDRYEYVGSATTVRLSASPEDVA